MTAASDGCGIDRAAATVELWKEERQADGQKDETMARMDADG